MANSLFGKVRAFVLGFVLLSRDSAARKLGRHSTALTAGTMVALYYAVQAVYFLYHGKHFPRETVSDFFSMFLQVLLAPVLYLGFHHVITFCLRPEVQSEFAYRVEQVRVALQVVWRGIKAITRAVLRKVNNFLVVALHLGVFLSVSTASLTRIAYAGSRVKLASFSGKWNRFANQCVQAGQNNRT